MFLNKIEGVLPGQFVRVKYDCYGGFERCGKEWDLKLKDAVKNHNDNNGLLICRQCQLKNNNPMFKKENVEKVKKTTEERYGTSCVMNTPENQKKQREKYKDPEYVTKITEKRRKTCLETYDVDHPMKTKEVQDRQREAIRESLGVDYPLQNKDVLEKTKQTNKERYGVEWGLSCPEIRLKGIETMLEEYGVTHYNKLPEMKEYLRQNCTEWLAESYKNPWAKGITRPEEWNEKQSKTMTDKIINGEINPEDARFYITGHYLSEKCKKKPAFFRSSLELKMHYLLNNDGNVEWYENEPFAIKYEKTPGVIRRYIPDFFVMLKTGKPKIMEMKPGFRMREEATQFKVEAANEFAREKGFDFEYIDEKMLSIVSLKELINLPNVTINKKIK